MIDENETPKDDQDKIAKAQRLYAIDDAHWSEIYTKAADDLYFQSDAEDAQWNGVDIQDRINSGRPALTIDQLGQFVHQVVNDIRMNTPTINVIPNTDGDVEKADVRKGLIRKIQQDSKADAVYDNAVEFSVKSSIGFIRVDHDFEDADSFDQKLMIESCINPQAILIDSTSIEPDGSDMQHAFVLDTMTGAEFKREYPGKDAISFRDVENTDSDGDNEKVTIAEYFYIDKKKITIGKRVEQSFDGMNFVDKEIIEEVQEGVEYTITRETYDPTVRRCKMSGSDVLEETTFPGKYVPIVPVYGEIGWAKGKRHLYSLIRKSKDAQRLYNYWRSLETELLMKQPNAPWVVAAGATENYKEDWVNPDKSMVLRYDTVDSHGNPTAPPRREAPPTIPTGIVNAARESVDDIKATMGMYGASIGERSNETSGVAINSRKAEGDVATFHFGDNLVRSITHVGNILNSAIPEIYDTARILTILGDEEEIKKVGVNGEMAEEQDESVDLTVGKYDITVTTGQPFTTQREEAAAYMKEIAMASPDLMNVMGDLLFKYQDFPGAQALSKRMEKMIDPKLLEEEGDEQSQEQQVIQQLQEQLQQMAQALESKQADEQLKRDVEQGKLSNESKKVQLEADRLEMDKMKALGDYSIKETNNEINAFKAKTDAEYKDVDSEIKVASTALKGIADLQQSSGDQADVNQEREETYGYD